MQTQLGPHLMSQVLTRLHWWLPADGFGSYAVLAGLAAVGASLLPVIGPILEASVPP
jgi:hypothetical protein